MKAETTGVVISVKKQWWLKVNTKAFRLGSLDGATFPHVIKVAYTVAGKEYFRKKWIGAGKPFPSVGENVTVLYEVSKPKKSKIFA